jgi:hypothetical protein
MFRRAAFTLEETTRDAACRIEFFLLINRQREERTTGVSLFTANHGNQNPCVTHRYHYGTAGLAGDLSRFQRDLMVTVLESLGQFIHWSISCLHCLKAVYANAPADESSTRAKASRDAATFINVASRGA